MKKAKWEDMLIPLAFQALHSPSRIEVQPAFQWTNKLKDIMIHLEGFVKYRLASGRAAGV